MCTCYNFKNHIEITGNIKHIKFSEMTNDVLTTYKTKLETNYLLSKWPCFMSFISTKLCHKFKRCPGVLVQRVPT